MKIKTLKTLIEKAFEANSFRQYEPGVLVDIKESVMEAIDLYEKDNESDNTFFPTPGFTIQPLLYGEPEEVPYGTICGCNPANGGSGICGCTLGNTMVKNPKKYGQPLTNWQTTTTIKTTNNESRDQQ